MMASVVMPASLNIRASWRKTAPNWRKKPDQPSLQQRPEGYLRQFAVDIPPNIRFGQDDVGAFRGVAPDGETMPVLVGKHPPQVGANHKARIGKAVFFGGDNLRRFQRIGPRASVGAARDDKSHSFPEVAGAGFQAVDAESGAVGGQYIRNPRAVFDPAHGHDAIADQVRLHQPVNEIPR